MGDAEWLTWIDDNLQLRVHLHEIVRSIFSGGDDLASFCHLERESTYDEAQIVQFLELDNGELVDRQMERYRSERLPRRFGLLEAAIVVRRNTARVRQMNQLWWQEISHDSHQDQLIARYALWTSNLTYCTLPGSRGRSRMCRSYPHRTARRAG